MYEITSESYEAYSKALDFYNTVKGFMGEPESVHTSCKNPCETCSYYSQLKCFFDFPESGTEAAVGCSMFEARS